MDKKEIEQILKDLLKDTDPESHEYQEILEDLEELAAWKGVKKWNMANIS